MSDAQLARIMQAEEDARASALRSRFMHGSGLMGLPAEVPASEVRKACVDGRVCQIHRNT